LVADTQAVLSFGSAPVLPMQRAVRDFKKMCQE